MNTQPLLEVPSMGHLTLSDTFQAQQNAAKRKVKAKLEAVMEDLVTLSNKVCEVKYWSSANTRTTFQVASIIKECQRKTYVIFRIKTWAKDEAANQNKTKHNCDQRARKWRENINI